MMTETPPLGAYAERVAKQCRPVRLRDGRMGWIGPLLPDDRDNLAREYLTLSRESQWRRFLTAVPNLTSDMLDRLVDNVDGVNHVALVVFVQDGTDFQPVAIGRIVRYEGLPDAADLAVTVKDDWQGHGIGSALVAALVEHAPAGVTHILTEIAVGNAPSLAMLHRVGEVQTHFAGAGVLDVEVDITGEGLRHERPAEGTRLHPVLADTARAEAKLRDRVCDELDRLAEQVDFRR
ncbi:MAG: GNAT family N-acetyltransferase [Tetrasphaera sp.]